MPQFAHLLSSSAGEEGGDQQQSLLPFIVRPANGASSTNNPIAMAKQFAARRKSACAGLFCVLVVLLLYIQFFSFPNQLQQIDEAMSIRNRERYQPTFSNQRANQKIDSPTAIQGKSGQFHPRQQVVAPKLPKFTGPTNDRQRAVRDGFLYAWSAYKKHAWGHDHLTPLSHSFQEWIECGLTIVDSLDTLLIMGLDDEFAEAKKWVESGLRFDRNRFVSLFETTIRILGGLLSAYHLSGEQIFLEKAEDIGQRLFPAISQSPSAVPYSDVNLHSGSYRQPSWSQDSSLAEIATIQLEFRDLARLSGNSTYEELSFRISEHIHESKCVKNDGGLCGMFLSPQNGEFRDPSTITFGARSDTYYEYLIKQWIQTGKTIDWLINDYRQAMESMSQRLWKASAPNGLYFVGEITAQGRFSPKMDHLVCFLAGILAMGTQHGMPPAHLELARNLSSTCHAIYQNPTGLGPEIAWFNIAGSDILQLSAESQTASGRKAPDFIIKQLDAHSLLRPEAFEAWFYMYRVTGDKQYQEWGWAAFQAIEKYAKLEDGDGYASVNNVKRIPVTHRDMMESFFLAESLKYLYLLLADDQTILPLDKWVFNTEAHPLPVRNN